MSTRTLCAALALVSASCELVTCEETSVSVAELAIEDEPAPPPEVPTIPLADPSTPRDEPS
jgi:hypothetical protein